MKRERGFFLLKEYARNIQSQWMACLKFFNADQETRKMLMLRRDQYKQAALKAKHAGDMPTATHNVKVAKVNLSFLTII